MLIKHVKINTYKSIKESLGLEILPINILIGKNNCGKTNILNAVQLTIDPSFDNTEIFYDKSDIELEFVLTNEEMLFLNSANNVCKLILKDQKRKIVLNNKEVTYSQKYIKLFSQSLKRLDESAFEDFNRIEEDFKSLFSYRKNLDNFKRALKKHFPKVSINENAVDMEYDASGLFDDNRRATINWLGSGFRRIFTILLYIYHPKYSIVFIDEPETHLHPAMTKHLLWAMQSSNAGQIFFTTHSPLFLNVVTLHQIIRVTKDNVSTRSFQLDRENYNYERLNQELNADNLEMFFSDEVVLVEGASDKTLMRGLINKFYRGDKDIKVIQTYGKGNARIYIEILDIFRIPFIVIFDKDVMQGPRLYELLDYMKISVGNLRSKEFFDYLKKYGIYIFPNGELENNYPTRYQRNDSKAINAFYASTAISQEDFDSKTMVNLKEIINNL